MLNLIRKKGCRRCHGNLSIESDIYGIYVQCIQCGAQYTEKDLREMIAQDIANAVKARSATPAPATGQSPTDDQNRGPGERWPQWKPTDAAKAPSGTPARA